MLQNIIKTTPSFILKMDGCPFCRKAMDALPDLKLYDRYGDADLVKDIMEKYNHKTFPMIFINGQFIGGFSDYEKKKDTL